MIPAVANNLQQLPAVISAAYQQIDSASASLQTAIESYWQPGIAAADLATAEPALWAFITAHTRNWDDSLGYDGWLADISALLRTVDDPAVRRSYHEKLLALLAPLMPLPELLRLRDLRPDGWQPAQLNNLRDLERWLEAHSNPYTRDSEQRDDPAFPTATELQPETLQVEIRAFIETLQQADYQGADAALEAFDAHREVRAQMDAYDLHRWLRWQSALLVDCWVERGLFEPVSWWDALLSQADPIRYVRDVISSEAQAIFSYRVVHIARRLAADSALLARFCAQADTNSVKQIIELKDNPLLADGASWLRLVQHTLPRGFFPNCRERPPAAQIYAALQPLFNDISDPELAQRVGQTMLHAELDSDAIRAVIGHCLSLCQQSGKNPRSYYWNNLLATVQDRALLRELLELDNDALRDGVLSRYRDLLGRDASWEELYDFAARHPDAIQRVSPGQIDVPLWRILWQSDVIPCRDWARAQLCNKLARLREKDGPAEPLIALFKEMAAADLNGLLSYLRERFINGWADFRAYSTTLLWQQHLPELDPLLLELLADKDGNACDASELALARDIITARPDYIGNLKPGQLSSLLPGFDQGLVVQTAPMLLAVLSKSTAQILREALVELFSRCEVGLLEQLGWLDNKTKNVRQACLEILLRHPDPAAREPLRRLCQAKGLDQTGRDRILDHLEAHGENVSELDLMSADVLAAALTQAQALKRVSKAVEGVYSDALAQRMPSLEPIILRWLLQQLATAPDGTIPRSVKRVWGSCPALERVSLLDALLQHWLAQDGNPKLNWLLRLLPLGGDDRLVGPLQDAVKAWYKKRKPRAVQAVKALASIDTTFALSQVQAISETRKYTDVLIQAAREELQRAAQRRQIPLRNLYDELVPDFGLGNADGLALDVGPYAYRVVLRGDLSLQVINPQGKTSKSLPKAKAGEDPLLRADVEARFKRLRKDLKTVADQQLKRLPGLLMSGRSWPAERWCKQFTEHPLFRSLAQSLIWSRRGPDGTVLGSFRLAEDLSLIDYEDEPVELADDEQIALWHPIDSDTTVSEAWRQHLDDYALSPVLAQVDLPVLRLQPEWQKEAALIAYQGHTLSMGKFKGLMARWGYRVGATEDGGYIYEHVLVLEEAQLQVELVHTAMPAWFDQDHTIALDRMTVCAIADASRKQYGVKRGQGIEPQQLPPAMLSMLLAQLQELAQSGEGYRADWGKL